jgi:hypothetical protein
LPPVFIRQKRRRAFVCRHCPFSLCRHAAAADASDIGWLPPPLLFAFQLFYFAFITSTFSFSLPFFDLAITIIFAFDSFHCFSLRHYFLSIRWLMAEIISFFALIDIDFIAIGDIDIICCHISAIAAFHFIAIIFISHFFAAIISIFRFSFSLFISHFDEYFHISFFVIAQR